MDTVTQAAPGLRREPPNRYVLAGEETRITYDATVAAGGPRLTYDGPYGNHAFDGVLATDETALGRLVAVHFRPSGEQVEGPTLTLLLPTFCPMTIWDAPLPFTTLAVTKSSGGGIVPPLLGGALERYRAEEMEGTAEFVGTLPEGVAADQLGQARLSGRDLPPTVDTLALSRATLPPGATARAVNGAHLFVVDAGALTTHYEELPLSGSSSTAGDWFLIGNEETPPKSITNEGTEPAVALVVSLAETGGAGVEVALPGWGTVEPLAVADAAGERSPLRAAGGAAGERIAVALVRVTYERAAGADLQDILVPATHQLYLESGELVVQDLQNPDPMPAPLDPGGHLLVSAPGRMVTHNAARGPSTVLIVSVGPAPAATGWC
jgi:hypothetical protein